MAKTFDKQLFNRLRSAGFRKRVARDLSSALAKADGTCPSRAVHGAISDLRKLVDEPEDCARGGPQIVFRPAKKAPPTKRQATPHTPRRPPRERERSKDRSAAVIFIPGRRAHRMLEGPDADLLVIDDGSTDGTAAVAARAVPRSSPSGVTRAAERDRGGLPAGAQARLRLLRAPGRRRPAPAASSRGCSSWSGGRVRRRDRLAVPARLRAGRPALQARRRSACSARRCCGC